MKNLFTIPAKVEDYSTYEVMYTLRSKCAGIHSLIWILDCSRMDAAEELKQRIHYQACRRFGIKIGGFTRHFLIRIRHIFN